MLTHGFAYLVCLGLTDAHYLQVHHAWWLYVNVKDLVQFTGLACFKPTSAWWHCVIVQDCAGHRPCLLQGNRCMVALCDCPELCRSEA